MLPILYVDDEENLLEITKLYLEEEREFHVDTSTSAKGALTLLNDHYYEAVICDFQMPEMDGIEFLRYIRKSGNTIPFILFTGKGREEIAIQALNEGADFYLQKGGDPEAQFAELTHQIKAAISRKQTEQKYRDLFSYMPSAVAIYEPVEGGMDFIFRDFNPAAEEIEGVKKEEVLGRHVTEVFPGVIEFGLLDVLKRVNETGKAEFFPAAIYRDSRDPGTWRENWVYKAGKNQVIAIYHDISEQKKAEYAIKESEEKYRTLFESMSTGVFYQMADGSLVDVNPAALRMFGLSYNQFTGRNSFDPRWKVIRQDGTTVPPGEHPSMVAFRTGKPFKDSIYGVYNPERDKYTWLVIDAEPQFRPGETHPYRVYVTMNDITERKTADDALRESQEQYRQVVEHAGEAIVIAQGEKLVFANPKTLRLLDVTLDELMAHSFTDFIHPDDRALVFERYKRRIQGETFPDRYEFRLIRTTGEITWVNISAVRITWRGNPATLNLLTDITQLKEREEEIFLKNTLLSTVQNASLDGILLVNEVGKVLEYNRNFVRLWNIPDELLKPGEDEPLLQYAVGQVSNPDEFLAKVRYLYDHRDEKYSDEITLKNGRVLERASAPILGDSGKYYGRVWYFHDITNRKKIEESLKKANRQLSLLGSITRHDINNKLTVITGYLNIARKRGQNAQMLEFIDKIETATNMIRSQIEFTKLYKDLGAKEPQWQNVDSVLPYSHVPPGIHLVSEVSSEIFADLMLEKVFFNLLDNSIRHGEHVTEIRVTAKIDKDSLKILWEDNGVGIPMEEKEKIFERGYGKNTGLGMFLVREILSLTDISITETGEPGKGARFEIVVPKGMYRIKS